MIEKTYPAQNPLLDAIMALDPFADRSFMICPDTLRCVNCGADKEFVQPHHQKCPVTHLRNTIRAIQANIKLPSDLSEHSVDEYYEKLCKDNGWTNKEEGDEA